MKGHTEHDLLQELFPDTARELFGAVKGGAGGAGGPTLGLFPVADGKLALVSGGALIELEPVEPVGKRAYHCDLCHVTRARAEVAIYRAAHGAAQGGRRYRYVTLCLNTHHCQGRAGRAGLSALRDRLLSH